MSLRPLESVFNIYDTAILKTGSYTVEGVFILKKYIVKRLLLLIPVMLGVSLIVFTVMHLFTSNPAATILGQHATMEQIMALNEKLGLNKPLGEQYWDYLRGALHGDLGQSLFTRTSVTKELLSRFPATVELAFSAILFASVFGVIIGVISAVKKNSIFDYAGMLVALTGVSMPLFWLGIMLILIFSVALGWLPPSGRIDFGLEPAAITGMYVLDSLLAGNWKSLGNAVRHLALPTVALGMYSMAIIARMTRSTMLDALGQDYIRTAWAKGLGSTAVAVKHALRNALIPTVTVIGLQLGSLLGGALLTETVFAWPGIGKYTVDSILRSDYPVVQGVVLLVAFVFVMLNLVVDIIYAFLDPRIKYS